MTKFITTLITAITLLFSAAYATPAIAKDPPSKKGWTYLASNKNSRMFIRDRDWMKGRSHMTSVKVWVWVNQIQKPQISHSLELLEINCPEEAFRILQITSYDNEHNSTGSTSKPSDWIYSQPDSFGELITELTCLDPQGIESSSDSLPLGNINEI